MTARRSASVGALPRENKHFVSRNESVSGISLDVRCACQYFESDSLLPERINPLDSRPSSKLGMHDEPAHYGGETQLHGGQQVAAASAAEFQLFQPMNLVTAPFQHMDELLSTRNLNASSTTAAAPQHTEFDRLSMRSVGAQRSWEQTAPPAVDLAFVEKYPELEETARARGLVVRSISDATEPDTHGGGTAASAMFMAGHRRQRQMSVGGISAGSGGMRDPDAISTRSVTSLRRISRSPSKADLFVADINIPATSIGLRNERREQRSMSTSRRTSNVDLSHFASQHALPASIYTPPILTTASPPPTQLHVTPQLNLIAPTPSPATADMRPNFERAVTPQRNSAHFERALTPQRVASPPPPPQDYRIAKPPASTDYMRPDENKENIPYYNPESGDVLPQHKPINVAKFGGAAYEPIIPAYAPPVDMKTWNLTPSRAGSRAPSPIPAFLADPLQQTVAQLEEITATRNLEDIIDNIKLETTRPPSFRDDIATPPLHLDEETKISIVHSVPTVDIDALIRSEETKAAEANKRFKPIQRQQSPPAKRQQSPPPQPPKAAAQQMDTLQLPGRRSRIDTSPRNQVQSQLKRYHTPERQPTPERSKRATTPLKHTPERQPTPERSIRATTPLKQLNATGIQPQSIQMHTVTINGAIPLQEASPEAKSTYASRFKSMFSSKTADTPPAGTPVRQSSPKRQASPSPKRERSPSPAATKIMSMFSRGKQTPMEMMGGSNAVISKKPQAEPMSVRVTETFSLKVDEMDQYTSRPAKLPPPSGALSGRPSSVNLYSSQDDFAASERMSASECMSASERMSVDMAEAFAPVVLSSNSRPKFLAGNRTLYSSEIDAESTRRSESEFPSYSKEPSMSRNSHAVHIPKGGLISVPIQIGSSGNIPYHGMPPQPPFGGSPQHSMPQRAPSEQRGLQPKRQLRKASFADERTQSQDRAPRITGSQDDLYGARMTKTVSFNFDERKSRMSEFENTTLSQQQKEKDFLERTYFSRDHEYEPIGEPSVEEKLSTFVKDRSPGPTQTQNGASTLTKEIEALRDEMKDAEELQKDLEERYFSSEATTPRTESRTDYEPHMSQVDSSALEELPLKSENRKKGFMASAQDRTRKMQAGFKNQAGKIKTKLRSPAKKPPSGSPKAKERKRFKAPEFSKIKMPEIKRPDMSKLKDFKRPEFTKFSKPDISKFKLPEKFSTLKLRRSKSFKENETVHDDEMSGITPESAATPPETQPHPQKKMFEFNFGTYPRAFRKKKKPEVEPELSFGTGTGTVSNIIPSTETQPSVESSSSPQGDRGPGPVRSRWADKFSDVSYNDSEGSRYRRYGSEQESFDRESSLERRMKEDLEETGSEAAPDLGILGGVADNKQYAEFDEENRAIHEISNLRASEFKRRPMVHQDSDLRSEDSKDAEGWTDKEIQKNKLLRKAELEAEASYLKYPSDEGIRQETLSTASSGKKVVMEEIDDDEFFLRKRGISEDNIELRQYISDAIREGYDMPINALQHVGQTGNEPMEYSDYDIPPPKPRRLHKNYRPEDGSQEFERSDYGDDLSMSQNGSDFYGAPKRPLRKGRSKYSMDSQDIPMADERISREQYFDDDEDYLRPPPRTNTTNVAAYKEDGIGMNNLDFSRKEAFSEEQDEQEVDEAATRPPQPHPPRRRKRELRESSMDKDSYVNGFSGRSVSNSYLQPPDDVIVYRTEHEYHIPLATPENYNTPDGASAASIKSRSTPRFDEDDRTSRGAVSLTLDDVNRPTRNVYDDDEDDTRDVQEKFVIDMMENDGYAIVRKEPIPKPTPPARRKKFSRSPGERFATMPNVPRTKRNTPPPERPPPPRGYTPSAVADNDEPVPPPPQRKPVQNLDAPQKYEDDDYEEPGLLDHERPESPRNLQSGEIINKMKYRPLPPPPRPPREKRQRAESKGSTIDDSYFGEGGGAASDMLATSSTADSYDQNGDFEDDASRFTTEEVEVSTQTDPLPDDYVCEEFEITDDMKVIEPRTRLAAAARTLDELLLAQEQQEATEAAKQHDNDDSGSVHTPLTEDEQLARGLQRFRDANQRSLSERSRATSSGDRSKSQSRPQTPSAVVIERRISTPVPTQQQHHGETILEASLIVRPIDDLDLEEEALRREGLLTDSSQQSKSDVEESHPQQQQRDEESAASATEEEESSKIVLSDYSQAPSTDELSKVLEEDGILSQSELESERGGETEREDAYDEDNEVERTMRAETERDDAEVKRTMRDYAYDEQKTELRYSSQYDEKEQQENVDQKEAEAREDEVKLSNVSSNFSAYQEQNVNDDVKEEVKEDPIKYDYERKRSVDREQLAARLKRIEAEMMLSSEEEVEVEPPLPPPRRKSTTTFEPSAFTAPIEIPIASLVEQQQRPLPTQEVEPVQSVVEPPPPKLPNHFGDLEVERLRVHALQAGQIMVSQLHGAQINADDLECKSGNLVLQNIALPPGFIEDIVERVRSTSQGSVGQLLTAETQTSLHGSSEILTQTAPTGAADVREQVPPPKPPRQRDLEAVKSITTTMLEPSPTDSATLIALERLRNLEEHSRTTETAPTAITAARATELPPPVYATAEYLQTLTPLAFYNAMRREEDAAHGHATAGDEQATHICRRRHHHHHHHHRRHRCDTSSSTVTSDEENEEGDLDNAVAVHNGEENGISGEERTRVKRSRSRHSSRHRSRSNTRPRELQKTQQSVGQAGRQFISACSLSLVDIINQLSSYVRRGTAESTVDNKDVPRVRHVPTLVVLFIVITFGLLLFLLSGRNVHTHHWDYFNPPGNAGRQS